MNHLPKPPRYELALGSPEVQVTPYVAPQRDPYAERAEATVAESDDLGLLLEYWRILWRHKLTVCLSLVLGVLISFIVSLFWPPLYRARATVEMQGVQEPFAGGLLSTSDPWVQTQVDLLLGQTLRLRVPAKMKGSMNVINQEAPNPLGPLRSAIGLSPPAGEEGWQKALSEAYQSLDVVPSKQSHVLELTCESTHPQVAADFVNVLAEEYIAMNMEERWETYQNTGKWLTLAQDQLKEKLEKSEKELVEFARKTGVMFTSDSQNVAEEKLKLQQAELSKARTERIAKQSVYESSLSSPTESLPEVLDYGPMASYQVKLAELRQQLAELSVSLTPAHYRVKRLQAQIDELQAAQERERTNIIKRIRIEYEAALRREKQLEADYSAQSRLVASQAELLIHYNILKREVDTGRELYQTTLQKGKEASIASALRASNLRIVDRALPPRRPYRPNLLLNSVVGVFGGLCCGVLLVIVRARSDSSVQVPGTMPQLLNLRELGVIPSAKVDPEARSLTPRNPPLLTKGSATGRSVAVSTRGAGRNGNGKTPELLGLVTWTRKISVISEAFRTAMTSILFSGDKDTRPRVLVLTSPSPQEGKSTIISNLAIAFSEIGQRVLLIDGDMRLPKLHTVFDMVNTWGLSDALFENTPIEEYSAESLVQKTRIPGLFIMTSGPARANIASLLYSERLNELLLRFRREFDLVLIDSPPVLSVPDSRILGQCSDAVVLVLRAGRTSRDSALAAARFFEEDGTTVLGTILNDWNPNQMGHGYYHSNYSNYYYHPRS